MKVSQVNTLDFNVLMKVLSSNQITETEKTQFVKKHKPEIEQIMKVKISSTDFTTLMQQRGLRKFRPLKNSFTKSGDKILLAKALNIKPSEVSKYIRDTADAIHNVKELHSLSEDKLKILKTYVYRHGSKDELVTFLDYELTKSKNRVKTLYKTLTYYSGGVADYFIRPIHRMDNKTLIKIYNIIYKNIKQDQAEGNISEADGKKIAKWALIRIYQIQNNSKLINAIKTYNTLK